ncbi:unnamed protein product, partial [Didymodactylos carnosus]
SVDVLLRIPFPNIDTTRKIMIEECELQYDDDQHELRNVFEFERIYNPEDAIFWLSNKNVLTEYRDQAMFVEELNKLAENIEKRVSINSFVSTTTQCDVALSFAGDRSPHPIKESVPEL